MRATSVVPVEERGETALLLESIGRRAQIDPLVLHRPPQALNEDVVVATTAPIHADLDAMIQQHPGERFTGELRPLIGIEDARLGESDESLAGGLNREPHRQGVRQTPRQDQPCRPIDERNKIQKPPTHRNVRDVCRPHLVRLIDRLVDAEFRR